MRARNMVADLFCDGPDLVLGRSAAYRDVDVDALAARRLHERRHAEPLQNVANDQSGLAHDLERRAGRRVEIEVQIERAIGILAERVPRIEIDAPEIDQPQEGWKIVDDWKVDDVAGAVFDRARSYPRRTRRRRALHVEEVSGNTVRIALHDHRAVGDVRNQDVGDARVVTKEIALGQLELGKIDFSQVGQSDPAAIYVESRVVNVIGNHDRGAAPFRTLRHPRLYRQGRVPFLATGLSRLDPLSIPRRKYRKRPKRPNSLRAPRLVETRDVSSLRFSSSRRIVAETAYEIARCPRRPRAARPDEGGCVSWPWNLRPPAAEPTAVPD